MMQALCLNIVCLRHPRELDSGVEWRHHWPCPRAADSLGADGRLSHLWVRNPGHRIFDEQRRILGSQGRFMQVSDPGAVFPD